MVRIADRSGDNSMLFPDGYHTTTVRVRYAETDKMGLAYNGHYLAWFEVGRTEFLREMGFSYRETEEAGYMLPLIEAGIKYVKPARYDDVLTIRSHIGSKPGIRLRINYDILRDSELLATGFTEHVFTDFSLCPKRPPKYIRDLITGMWGNYSGSSEEEKKDD